MPDFLGDKSEKKVEYLELIYDLIFVYIIGRNSSLLHNVQGGFVPLGTFYAYILCSLAVIQIWSFSTFYINMCGRNGLRDHIFLFVNMYAGRGRRPASEDGDAGRGAAAVLRLSVLDHSLRPALLPAEYAVQVAGAGGLRGVCRFNAAASGEHDREYRPHRGLCVRHIRVGVQAEQTVP